MTDEMGDRSTALVNTARQLPARTDLVNRGVALAQRLLSGDGESRESAIEASLSNALHAWITALELSDQHLTEGPLRDRFRETCLSAYHWALAALMMAYEVPFRARHPNLRDDLLEHVATAGWLSDEGQIGVDIEPHLLGLSDDQFNANHVCVNLKTFLDEVTAFLEHGSPFMRLRGSFDVKELKAALKWPHFIVNIEKMLRLVEEEAAEARRTGISRILTLEDAYRMVVSPTT